MLRRWNAKIQRNQANGCENRKAWTGNERVKEATGWRFVDLGIRGTYCRHCYCNSCQRLGCLHNYKFSSSTGKASGLVTNRLYDSLAWNLGSTWSPLATKCCENSLFTVWIVRLRRAAETCSDIAFDRRLFVFPMHCTLVDENENWFHVNCDYKSFLYYSTLYM